MKILRVAPTLGKGGAEDIIVNLSNHEVNEHDVTLLLFKRTIDDEYNISLLDKKIKLITLLPNFLHKKNIFLLACYILSPLIGLYSFFNLKINKYDIVHINMTAASFYSIIWQIIARLSLNNKTKFVETYHTNWHLIGRFQKIIFKISWKLKDAVVYEIYKEEKTNILKSGINESKLTYIPFGIRPSNVNQNTIDNFRKNFIANSQDILSLMTISRLRLLEKKIDSMLLACKYLLSQEIDFHFYICGDGKDKHKIELIIKEYELENYVTLTGYIDDPISISSLCDVYLCAMVGDNTGISGLQAALNEKAVLGIQTLMNHRAEPDDKVFFSSSDPKEIAQKIKNLTNQKTYSKYARSCKEIVQETYLSSVMCSQYEKLYKSLSENK